MPLPSNRLVRRPPLGHFRNATAARTDRSTDDGQAGTGRSQLLHAAGDLRTLHVKPRKTGHLFQLRKPGVTDRGIVQVQLTQAAQSGQLLASPASVTLVPLRLSKFRLGIRIRFSSPASETLAFFRSDCPDTVQFCQVRQPAVRDSGVFEVQKLELVQIDKTHQPGITHVRWQVGAIAVWRAF